MWRWLQTIGEDPNASMTALATVFIAIFTVILVVATINQNSENTREYVFTPRARIIIDIDSMEIKDFGDGVYVVVPEHNDGGSAATEVDIYMLGLYTNGKLHFDYSQLQQPKSADSFRAGFAIAQGQTIHDYVVLPKDQESAIKNGAVGLRIVGRIAYWDDFGSYCESFAALYRRQPARFAPAVAPPSTAVCDPNTTDSEDFSWVPDKTADVAFHLLPS